MSLAFEWNNIQETENQVLGRIFNIIATTQDLAETSMISERRGCCNSPFGVRGASPETEHRHVSRSHEHFEACLVEIAVETREHFACLVCHQVKHDDAGQETRKWIIYECQRL